MGCGVYLRSCFSYFPFSNFYFRFSAGYNTGLPVAVTEAQKGNPMKGKPEVIAVLSEMLKEELGAINQYMLHAEMQENWGYPKLAQMTKMQSIGEMKHAEQIMERILFLEGMPQMDKMGTLRIGKDVKQQIENDLALEKGAVTDYNKAMETCRKAGDNASADFLLIILKDEEQHVDQLETQLQLIAQLGLENYLAQQMGGGTAAGAK
jgi:bacterioferritin